jgi:hypothetical protein
VNSLIWFEDGLRFEGSEQQQNKQGNVGALKCLITLTIIYLFYYYSDKT